MKRLRGRWSVVLAAEALLVLAVYAAYSVMRVVVAGDDGQAFDNAVKVIELERRSGVFVEAELQAAITAMPGGAEAMRQVYLWGYYPFLIGTGVLLYVRNRMLYAQYRNAFFLAMGIGLVFFAVLPVAPPRMFPELGFADLLNEPEPAAGWKNEFAAVPSFHCGFTLLAGVALAHLSGWRMPHSIAACSVPAVMLLSVVATGNHYFIDALVGWAIVLTAWSLMVRRGERSDFPPAPMRLGDQRL